MASAVALADALVQQRNLQPPVDVHALVAEVADVVQVVRPDLRFDAFVHGLGGERARPVLVYDGSQPQNRVRFTLAHELGHLLLSWHLGTIVCQPNRDLAATGSALGQLIGPIESEANAFAGRLLVPARVIRAVDSADVPALLHAVGVAQVSTQAGLVSLTRLLPPGHLFASLDADGRVQAVYLSRPTRAPAALRVGAALDRASLRTAVDAEGIASVGGRHVWWGRFAGRLPVGEGSADWQGPLEAILADYAPGETRSGRTWKSLNGIASAANSSSGGAGVDTLAASISRAFRTHREHADVALHPRFDEFVAARARAFRSAPGKASPRTPPAARE